VAASTALAACHRSDSILLVEVAGDLALHPAQLSVEVTVGTQTRSLEVPATAGAAISLPVSFSIELDPSLTGPVTLTIEATNASGAVIAQGTTTQDNIDVGGQTLVTVTLVSGSPPGLDGGDGGVDASGSAGAGGAGAGGGASGGGGSGGVGGRGGGGASGGRTGRGGLGGGASAGRGGGGGGAGAGGAGGASGGRGGVGGSGGGTTADASVQTDAALDLGVRADATEAA
jgi:hypothetical protein